MNTRTNTVKHDPRRRIRRSRRFLRVAGGLLGALVLASIGLFGSSILAGGALANHGGFPGLSIDDNPDPITLGDQLTYDVHFTGPADTVEIYDTLPAEAEFVSSDCSPPQAGIVQCTEFAVASGEVRTNRFVVRPTSAGTITNNARAEEAGVTVDSDSEATLVLGQPGSETVQGPVAAGGTATTDSEGDGATAADPLETSVTTPNSGSVTIAETAGAPPATTAFSFLGQQVAITAPAASPGSPLVLVFLLDASILPPGTTAANLQVFRNGVLVPSCTGAPGTASPDPCVSGRATLADGDVQLTILTSAASDWTFGSAITTRGAAAGALQPLVGQATVFGIVSNGSSVAGLLKHGSYTATRFIALAIDDNKAWFAGIGRDGRTLLAYVEDNGRNGQGDIFKLWIAGVLQTGDGRLARGDVGVVR